MPVQNCIIYIYITYIYVHIVYSYIYMKYVQLIESTHAIHFCHIDFGFSDSQRACGTPVSPKAYCLVVDLPFKF